MSPEPSDEDLIAFAEALLQGVGPHLRERTALEEAIRLHRGTWVVLYQASQANVWGGTKDVPAD